jgi:hypothetical protein
MAIGKKELDIGTGALSEALRTGNAPVVNDANP